MVEFSLRFTQIECEACGAETPMGVPCSACASPPTDNDPHVGRRVTIVAQLRRAAVIENIDASDLQLEELWSELGSWVDDFMRAIAELSSDGDSPSALDRAANHLGRLLTVADALQRVPRMRPSVAHWQVVESAVQEVMKVADYYLAALTAPGPSQAEQLAVQAQQAIDKAAEYASRASSIAARLGLAESGERLLERLASVADEAFSDLGAADIVDFEARGAALFEKITGDSDCPTGMGVGLALILAHVEAGLDARRFQDVTKAAFNALDAGSASVDGLISNGQWRQAFEDASTEMFDLANELDSAIADSESTPRLGARAAIRFGAQMTERVAQPLLATLLCVHGRKDWRSMKEREIRTLLGYAQNAGFGSMVFGLDLTIRDADAHGAFTIADDSIEFTSDRREYDRLSSDELVDRVLGSLESCLALHTAITCALVGRGVRIDEIAQATQLMSPSQQLALALGLNGLGDRHIELAGDRVRIEARASYEVHKPLAVVASLHPYLPDGIVWCELAIQDPGMLIAVSGPVDALSRWSAAEGIEKESRFMDVLTSWSVNGRPVATADHVRKWAAIRAGHALQQPSDDATEVFSSLESMAHRAGDRELARSMASLRRLTRARARGRPGKPRDRNAPDRVVAWMDLDLAPLTQDPRRYLDSSEASPAEDGPPGRPQAGTPS